MGFGDFDVVGIEIVYGFVFGSIRFDFVGVEFEG